MVLAVLFAALQVATIVFALLSEREDKRFEGDKLIYRS